MSSTIRHQLFSSRPETFGEHQLNEVLEAIRRGEDLFPYKRLFYDPNHLFENLCRLDWMSRVHRQRRLIAPFKTTFRAKDGHGNQLLPFEWDGGSLSFVHRSDDYHQMDVIADIFQEPARLSAKVAGRPSPLEIWRHNLDGVTERAIRTSFRRAVDERMAMTPFLLRESFYEETSRFECTQFKPSLALMVYRIFEAERVLDPCAGWGDRLIAAIAAGVEYHGVDPNPRLVEGHKQIIETFSATSAFVECLPFEEFETDKTFDLVFTSPPFFDWEIYSDDENQSSSRHPEFVQWFKNFLLVMVEKAWSRLEMGGHFVLYLSDIPRRSMCEPLLLWMCAHLEHCSYEGLINSFVETPTRPRPLWVLRKRVPDLPPIVYRRAIQRSYRWLL